MDFQNLIHVSFIAIFIQMRFIFLPYRLHNTGVKFIGIPDTLPCTKGFVIKCHIWLKLFMFDAQNAKPV